MFRRSDRKTLDEFSREAQAGKQRPIRPFESRMIPQPGPSYTQLVEVINKGQEHADWSAFTPVGVCMPSATGTATDILKSGSLPKLPGCRMNDFSFNDGKFRMLGITQEPIPYGKSGRVCIRGITQALVQAVPSGWNGPSPLLNYQSQWVQVHYDSDTPRWVLRAGRGGDARLLQILDTTKYQDGTYNDQYLALIDLCEAPHIVPSAHYYNATNPYSGGTFNSGTGGRSFSSGSGGYVFKGTLAASPGWTVPAYKSSRIYLALPEGVPVQGRCGRVFNYTRQCGCGFITETTETTNQFFGGAPGCSWVAYGWFQTSNSSVENRLVWLQRKLPDRVWLKVVDGLTIYLLSKRNGNAYDGGTYSGITYPTGQMSPSFIGISGGGNFTSGRDANICGTREFYATYDPAESLLMADDPSVWDDAIGTVKMWSRSEGYIPDGWRRFTSLNGRFPKGFDGTTYLPPATHTHSGVTTGTGATSAASAEPNCYTILFIERYQ